MTGALDEFDESSEVFHSLKESRKEGHTIHSLLIIMKSVLFH